MRGFDSKYRDLPDYILQITHQIWEEKDVESINQYYAKGMPTRSPQGVIYGADPVVKATYACLLYTSPSPRDQRGSRMPSSA